MVVMDVNSTDAKCCLNLSALFNFCLFLGHGDEDEVWTMHGHTIRREAGEDGDYYDLYRKEPGSLRLCCDGEECLVTDVMPDAAIRLIDSANVGDADLDGIDTTFILSVEELAIATGCA